MDWLEQLDRRVRAVPESSMRRALVYEALGEALPEEGIEALRRVLTRPPPAPGSGGSAVDLLRDAILDVLSGRDPAHAAPYEVLRQLYERASATGDEAILEVLRSSRPAPEAGDDDTGLPRAVAELPLGVRRSLARGDDPHLLEKLGRDIDPLVIRHLLLNPRTREEDVLRIASRRPACEAALLEIHRSPRWAHRTRVRVALARNPGCPIDVAVRAIGGIPLTELRDLARDGTLRPELRSWAERECERREVGRR